MKSPIALVRLLMNNCFAFIQANAVVVIYFVFPADQHWHANQLHFTQPGHESQKQTVNCI